MTGRAETPEQKRAVIERILAAWERRPDERLGHLISESLRNIELPALAAVGDRELANLVERLTVPREAAPEENFAALKRMAPSLAGVYERAAAKRGIQPWEATEEMAWEECPALGPAPEGRAS